MSSANAENSNCNSKFTGAPLEGQENNIDDLSDGEIERIVNSNFDLIQKELDIKKRYHLKFKKTLSIKKTAQLYHAEKEFKRTLLQRIKRGKENHKKRK